MSQDSVRRPLHEPRRVHRALCALASLILAGCFGGSSSGSPGATAIELTATSATVAKGTSTQLTATAIYSDNSHADVTNDLDWYSSSPAVATVSSGGKVTTVGTGNATISVTCAVAGGCGTLSASFIVTVTPATVVSIALSPTAPSIAAGTSQQFTATGTFSDNTTQNLSTDLTWTSSNASVATVGVGGLVSTLASGSVAIAATCKVATVCSSLSGTATLTVTPATVASIALTPSAPSIAAGTTQQLIATATFSDQTTQNLGADLTWTSSNPAVATVSGVGLVGSVATGSVTIAATCKVTSVCGSLAGTTTVTVTAATLVSIVITPAAPRIVVAATEQFVATGTYSDASTQILTGMVTWTSSVTSVAAVSNANPTQGLATGLLVGSSSISATLGGVTATAVPLTVTPPPVDSVLYSFSGGTDGGTPGAGLIQGVDGNYYGTTIEYGANGKGTVFKLTPAGVETVVWSFGSGTDGTYPYAGLLQGADGNFYGTTYGGGAYGGGTVFQLTPGGVETVLWSFGSGTDGQNPIARLIQGADGNLYGTTNAGGVHSEGTIFKLTPGGVETVLWSFGGAGDGAVPYAGLIQGIDGNFYGTTNAGGASSQSRGTIFKLTPGGVETVLWSFGSGTDGQDAEGGLLQGADGNFYGTTYGGGANSQGTVYKITPAGVETVLWSFGSGTDGQSPTSTLIQGADGNLYGTTYTGGANSVGTIFRITPAGTETVIWSFGSGTDGQNPEGQLIQGADGHFYGTTAFGGANADGTAFKF